MRNNILKGQVWQYHTRIGEEDSLLTILHVESSVSGERVAHISIDCLKSKHDHNVLWSISHIPISIDALIPALKEVKTSLHIDPRDNEGYVYWESEYKKGKAGVWSIDLINIINLTEDYNNQT